MLQQNTGRPVETFSSWICSGCLPNTKTKKQLPSKDGLFESLLQKLAVRNSALVRFFILSFLEKLKNV